MMGAFYEFRAANPVASGLSGRRTCICSPQPMSPSRLSVSPFLKILMRTRVSLRVSRSSGLQFCYSPWVQTKFPGIRNICLHYPTQPPLGPLPGIHRSKSSFSSHSSAIIEMGCGSLAVRRQTCLNLVSP